MVFFLYLHPRLIFIMLEMFEAFIEEFIHLYTVPTPLSLIIVNILGSCTPLECLALKSVYILNTNRILICRRIVCTLGSSVAASVAGHNYKEL